MKFASPAWLWAFLLLPLFYFLLCWDDKMRQNQLGRFARQNLWPRLIPELNDKARIRKGLFWLMALGFTFLALAKPQFGSHEEVVKVSGLDVVLALDVSNSMYVEDVTPSRLKKAKHVIRSLLDRLNGDRVGIVAFAGSAYVACPLTSDLSYVWDTVQILSPKTIQNQGTDVGGGLETAFKALERGAEDVIVPSNGGKPSRALILISDGEDHEGGAMKVASQIQTSGTRLYILGVGTEKGGPIPLKDENGNLETYKKDRSGQPVVSTFHSDFLSKLAQEAGGKYWNISATEDEVFEVLEELGALNRTDYAERRYLVYEDRYQIPLLLAIICLLLEISIPARKVMVGIFLASTVIFGFRVSSAQAGDWLRKPAPLDSYLENKKGIQAYQEGRMEEAEKEFGAAQARDPMRAELEYNQGVVQFQKGQMDQAIGAFQNSARSALDKGDKSLFGKSLYNLGNTYAKKGDFNGALQSYLGAIQTASQTKDRNLEKISRKNLQLLLDEMKKQKEQQQDQQQQQQQGQQQKQEQQGQQSQQDQKQQQQEGQQQQQAQSNAQQSQQNQNQSSQSGKDQNQDQGKNGSEGKEDEHYKDSSADSRQQQFQSKKMTPEDADRVMSELTNKERELQEKLQTQHVQSENNSKDW